MPPNRSSKRTKGRADNYNAAGPRMELLEADNRIRVLKLFLDGPGRQLHIREVARLAGLSPRGAQRILESLRDDGILISEPNDIVNNYRGNFEDERLAGLKRALNLYSMYSSGLVGFLEKFYRMPECIVLFGSYAKGDDRSGISDIDIAIVTDMEEMPEMDNFQAALGKSISLHLTGTLKDQNANFRNSLANGIVLSGYMEAI